MKTEIHPKYQECTITCACGHVVKTRGTLAQIRHSYIARVESGFHSGWNVMGCKLPARAV